MSAVASDPLEIAVAILAARCDGAVTEDHQGFNGADTVFGHSLAEQTGRWTPKQRASARTLVQKYRRQVLEATGIDVAEIQTFNVGEWMNGEPLRAIPSAPPSVSRKLTAGDILGPGGTISQRLPGYEHRASQLSMASLVSDCIAAGEHGVIEAGTGTGKSLGYLVPAILSGKKTIVSTADKALQDQIFNKDIPFLQTVMPRPFTAALLKGRSNYLCLHKVGKLTDKALLVEPEFLSVTSQRTPDAARNNATLWKMLLEWRSQTESGDLDSLTFDLTSELRGEVTVTSEECLQKKCPLYDSCFVERAKSRAADADVIVVNHSLLVRDLAIRADSDGHAHILPDAEVCVVDESHNLASRAVDALGGEITAARWKRIDKKIASLTVAHPATKDDPGAKERAGDLYLNITAPVGEFLLRSLEEIKTRVLNARGSTQKLGAESMLAIGAAMVRSLAGTLADQAPDWLEDDEYTVWQKTIEQLVSLSDDLAAAATPADADLVRYAQIEGTGSKYERVVLHVKPIDVAPALRRMLFTRTETRQVLSNGTTRLLTIGYSSVIATSATLADGDGFGHWRARVGLDSARELAVTSPFDYQSHALLYLPPDAQALDSSQYRGGNEAAYFDNLAAAIGHLLAASKGRAFCLFTSNKALRECYDRLWSTLPYRVLKQGDRPRAALLMEFKADASSVLFATKSFWEGVDVQGDALSLVVIDKLPFAPPDDPLWEAKCAAVNRRASDQWAWFGELAIPEATIALKQGVGRLIRSKTDTGVFAILDGRLVSKKYGATILRALPPAPVTQSLEDVQAFFDR